MNAYQKINEMITARLIERIEATSTLPWKKPWTISIADAQEPRNWQELPGSERVPATHAWLRQSVFPVDEAGQCDGRESPQGREELSGRILAIRGSQRGCPRPKRLCDAPVLSGVQRRAMRGAARRQSAGGRATEA